jgi:ribosomal protein S18 acetylase RimI-like enzyme
MEIRAAREEDVPQVLPMVGRICAMHESMDPAKYGFGPGIEGMYDSWLRNRAKDKRSVFLVAEREGRVVAFLVGTVEKEIGIYRLKEYGFIHDMWVEEVYRHEGIGRQMAMLAIERFNEIGVKQMRLDTAWKNEAARKLFESCGFRPSVVEMLMEMNDE